MLNPYFRNLSLQKILCIHILAADVYQYSYVNVNTYIKYGYGDEYEGWGFESPSGRDIFCLKIFDTFPRTPVLVLKINAVARAQLTF